MFNSLLIFAALYVIYALGFFAASIALHTAEPHYFLGWGRRGFFSFQIKGVRFTIGWFIPVLGLARVYAWQDGEKKRARYPWEFSEQSIGRRVFVTLSGALTFLLFGMLVSIGIYYFKDEYGITKAEVNRHGIYPSAWAREAGFHRGDRIVGINGRDFQQFADLMQPEVIMNPESYFTVERDSQQLNIKLDGVREHMVTNKQYFISLDAPFEISQVFPGGAAAYAGILVGDRVVKLNGSPIVKIVEFQEALQATDDTVTLEIVRPSVDSVKTIAVTAVLGDNKNLGIATNELIHYTARRNTFGEAIAHGVASPFRQIAQSIGAFFKLFRGKLNAKAVSGPIRQDRDMVLFRISFGAVCYALWNVFPLPLAAFWELIPLGYEAATKRNYRFNTFQKTLSFSWIVVALLLAFIFVQDVIKFLA